MIIRDVWPRFSRKGLVVPFIIFSIALVTLFSASENGEKYNSEIVYQCQNKTDTFISSLCNCHKSYTVKIYNNFLGISTPRNFFHKTCGEKVQNFWGYFHNANVVGLTISILGLGVGVKTPNS